MDQYRIKQYISAHPDEKLRDLVAELLYDDIVELRIAPGSKLNVNQLASAMSISRTPVAEAIAKLTEIGFVVNHPGQSGSYVMSLNMNDMINLYQVRSAVECEGAALCAYNADDSTVRELTQLADAFKDSVIRKDIRGMKDTDMPFHKLIIASCGNEYLKRSYEQLLPKLTMYQYTMTEFIARSNNDNPWMASVRYNHISVVSAIRLRMPELARKSMDEHVTTSLNFTTFSGNMPDPFSGLNVK